MKKVSLWLTLLVMLMVVSACGGTPPETAQPTEEPVVVEEEAAPEEEEPEEEEEEPEEEEAAPEEEEAAPEEEEPEEEEAAPEEEEPEEEEAAPEEEEAAPEEEAPSESDAMSVDIDPIRIAVVMPSATTDLAWSQSIYDALLAIQEEAGGEEVVEIAFTEGMFNVTDAAAALRDYAADGYNLVIAHGTQYGSSLFEIAPDFPDTSFAYGTATDVGTDAGLENVFAYEARAEEGGYVNGVLAASLSESGVIGVVGPVEAGDAKLYIDGFLAGAEATNPDIVVNVSYTGSFGDTALAAEAANVHIDAGADILTGSAQQVVGAIGVANEAGVPWMGTQSDQSPLAPEIVVASQLYDWVPTVLDMINKHQAGEVGGSAYKLTLENGGLVMDYQDGLDSDAVASAEKANAGIAGGAIDAFSAAAVATEESGSDEGDAMSVEIDPIRIAIVMPSATTDLAWSQSIYDALLAIQEEAGGEEVVEIAFTEGMFNVTDAAAALRDYAADDYNLVIAHGTQYGSSLFEIAPDFPDTSFAYGTATDVGTDAGLENVFAYEARAEEGGYVNGVLAASLSESGVIGVVGPVEAGDAKLYIDGFLAGAEATNPDIVVNVSYTGSFGDTALAAEAANVHIDAGADILTGSAQQVVGAIGVANEAGVPWMGTQSDQSPLAPEIVVASQLYDWVPTVLDMINKHQAGEVGGSAYKLTLENGGLVMDYQDGLDSDAVASAEKANAGIAGGAIDAFSAAAVATEESGSDEGDAMSVEIDPIRIAIVMPSATTDLAWSQSIYDALLAIQEQAGGEEVVEIAFTEGMFNVTDAAAALRDYAADDYNLVIAHGTQYGSSLFEIAPDFPDTSFAYGTATDVGTDAGLENVFAYEARAEEGGYVNGVLAASLSESGVIGVVGPVEAGDAKLYIDGFLAGAEATNPDIVVNVSYTGSFGDTALAAEAANVHIDAGADILTGSAQQVVGAIGVANEAGVPWMGTQSDQSPLAPEIVVASQLYDWVPTVLDMINKHQAGEVGGSAYKLTLENGGLVMDYQDGLDSDAVASAEKANAGIAGGAIDAFSAAAVATEESGSDEGDAMSVEIDPIRIAIVMPSATTDLAWSQSIYDALLAIQEEAGGEEVVEIAFTEGMFNVTDAAAALRDYAADDYNLVIAHGTQYGSSLFEIAPDFPDTSFAYGTATDVGTDAGLENVFAYEARAEEGGYVNGVLAASLSESGVIGVVGPVEAGDAKLYIDGFLAGAEATNPDIVVNVSYTGSFGDTALAAEAANVHIDAGADILTGSAQQVVGAIGVANEAGVPWMGTQSDQSPLAPEIVVASQLYDWVPTVLDIIQKHQAGEVGGSAYKLTLENGGLVMDYQDGLDEDAVGAAEEANAGISAGDISVEVE